MFRLREFIYLELLLLSVCMAANTQANGDAVNGVRTFDDVFLEHYSDPCEAFSPKMPDFRAPGRRISEVKCFEYVWKAKLDIQKTKQGIECDAVHNLFPVLGGKIAKFGDYAHVGALGWETIEGTWIFKCGASLISEKFALTAAHCSRIRRDPNIVDIAPKIVRLGAESITEVHKHMFPRADGNITRIIVHPNYRAPRKYYDIALIEFEQEISATIVVHPSCLDSSFSVPENLKVAGWGVINLATLQTSPILQEANVVTVESSQCDNLLYSKRNRNWNGVVDHQICAGNMTGRVDTCQGDSGGPLSYFIPNAGYENHPIRWTVHKIVGVTSFGYSCGRANSPGIYTRVASFIDWIEGIVWPTKF